MNNHCYQQSIFHIPGFFQAAVHISSWRGSEIKEVSVESMYAPPIQAVHAKFIVCERKDGRVEHVLTTGKLSRTFSLFSDTYLSFSNLLLSKRVLFEEGEPGRGTLFPALLLTVEVLTLLLWLDAVLTYKSHNCVVSVQVSNVRAAPGIRPEACRWLSRSVTRPCCSPKSWWCRER